MGWQSDSRANLPVEPLQQQHNNQPWSVGDIGILITIYDIYYIIMSYYDDISDS